MNVYDLYETVLLPLWYRYREAKQAIDDLSSMACICRTKKCERCQKLMKAQARTLEIEKLLKKAKNA